MRERNTNPVIIGALRSNMALTLAVMALSGHGEPLVSPAGWGDKHDPEDTPEARRKRYADEWKSLPKELTEFDRAALERAEAKRERKAAKRHLQSLKP